MQATEQGPLLTACVAQLAACSYSVGWYRLSDGALLFMNLEGKNALFACDVFTVVYKI